MTTLANISTTKADNTTALVFVPILSNTEVTRYREQGAANLLAAIMITLSALPVKKGSGQLRKRMAVYVPVMETATGANSSGYTAAPKVAFPIFYNLDQTTSLRATEQQNIEARNIVSKVLLHATVYPFFDRDERAN